ncbi:MAG: amidohydrolase [Myxococcales bacterium]|nr:amidohydrolase [Myxococcales bacterium]
MKRLNWLRKRKKHDPDVPLRAPLPLGPMSNGEFFHPDNPKKQLIRKLIFDHAEVAARKHNVDRREFLASAAGVCTSLYMVNLVTGCSGGGTTKKTVDMGASDKTGAGGSGGSGGVGGSGMPPSGGEGGAFAVTGTSTLDNFEAEECLRTLSGDKQDFIVDMQAHFVNDQSPYLTNPLIGAFFNGWLSDIRARVPWAEYREGCTGNDCYNADSFFQQYFMESDTTVGVLSGIPYVQCAGQEVAQCDLAPLTNQEIRDTKDSTNSMFDTMSNKRVLSHAMVMPNDRLEAQLEAMAINAEEGVDNWKVYTVWAPGNNGGYWLDDPAVGIPMIEQGIKVGVPIFCCHKGFPLPGFSRLYSDPKDIGVVAKAYPEASFVVYHSSFEHNIPGTSGQGVEGIEGPWPDDDPTGIDPVMQAADSGVNALIKTLKDNGIEPNDPTYNVYAELGGVMPTTLITRPREFAHIIGKLCKYVGEDRVVWGTDCLWFGSPQPIIEAFRAFQMPEDLIENFGYPELTDELKLKIMGMTAARLQDIPCGVQNYPQFAEHKQLLDDTWGPRRYMMRPTPGPRTRREFLRLAHHEHRVEKVNYSGFTFGKYKV